MTILSYEKGDKLKFIEKLMKSKQNFQITILVFTSKNVTKFQI